MQEDITEQERVQQQLEMVFEMSLDLVCISDINTATFIKVNPTFRRILGYSEDELLGRSFLDFIHPDDVQPTIDLIERDLKKGTRVLHFENRYRTKQGDYRLLDWSSHPSPEEGVSFAVGRDITERREAATALEESQRMLSTLMSNLPGMAYRCRNDEHWTMEFVSDGCKPLTGYAPEELIENRRIGYAELIHPGYRQQVQEIVEKNLARRQAFELTYPITTADGRDRWVWERGRGVFASDGSLLFLEGFISDVTERKEAETVLLDSEQRMRVLFEQAADAICVMDFSGRITSANEEACRSTGYTREELLGRRISEVSPSIDSPERLRTLLEGIAEEQTTTVETTHRRKDGSTFPVEVSFTQLATPDGPRILAVARDISERLRAEEERLELEAQLRQAQKMEAVGQLAGGVAHDFNNILTAILGNVELNMECLLTELGEDHRAVESLWEIEKAARRASALTRQLLTFSRRDVLQPRVLNLNSLMEELDRMLRRLITEDIELTTFPGQDLLAVRADAGQLEQVIVNLVINAVHAMPDGGKLTLETYNTEIDADYARTHTEAQVGSTVTLAVSDTGHGMDAETQERIFEPFFTTKPADKGTGLGLATVHGIVKQAGGHIQVYSEPGHGTTFKVYLPAIQATAIDEAAASPPPAPSRGSETILLCEDDAPVRELVVKTLESAGYTVISAGTGQQGIEAIERHAGPVHLLMTDVIMPDMNGRALSDHLQSMLPGLPTLYISGYTSNLIAQHGVLDEGIEFLEKPFTRQGLLEKVGAVLSATRKGG